jgi:ribonuclease R
VKKAARHGQIVLAEVTQRPFKRVNAAGKVPKYWHHMPGMEIEVAGL